MREPFGGKECMVIICQPIENALSPYLRGIKPTYCRIVGMTREGKHIQFEAPIKEFEEASKSAAQFIEVNDIRAPNALVGSNGKPIGIVP